LVRLVILPAAVAVEVMLVFQRLAEPVERAVVVREPVPVNNQSPEQRTPVAAVAVDLMIQIICLKPGDLALSSFDIRKRRWTNVTLG
jgi:hypothetical protein